MNCKLCGRQFTNRYSLGQHVRMGHMITIHEYIGPRLCVRCNSKIENKGTKYCSQFCWAASGIARRAKDQKEQAIKRKTRCMCSSLLHMTLNAKGGTKTTRTAEMLGYGPFELREHLEQQFTSTMNWQNHGIGSGKWNIDHIRPVNTFPKGTHPAIINAISNLRPLWFEENVRRPYDGSDVL